MTVNKIKTTIYSKNITTNPTLNITLNVSVYNRIDDTNQGVIIFKIDNEEILTSPIINNKCSENYTIHDSLTIDKQEL